MRLTKKLRGNVYLRVRCFVHIVIAIALAVVGTMGRAQAAVSSDGRPDHCDRRSGHDSCVRCTATLKTRTGALIPGAQLTVTTAKGAKVTQTSTDAAGGYSVKGLAADSYVIQATYPGFCPIRVSTDSSDRRPDQERRYQDGH